MKGAMEICQSKAWGGLVLALFLILVWPGNGFSFNWDRNYFEPAVVWTNSGILLTEDFPSLDGCRIDSMYYDYPYGLYAEDFNGMQDDGACL